jgi:hypothetical protein
MAVRLRPVQLVRHPVPTVHREFLPGPPRIHKIFTSRADMTGEMTCEGEGPQYQ